MMRCALVEVGMTIDFVRASLYTNMSSKHGLTIIKNLFLSIISLICYKTINTTQFQLNHKIQLMILLFHNFKAYFLLIGGGPQCVPIIHHAATQKNLRFHLE